MELPTNPAIPDLVQEFKKLLELTDFNNRSNTKKISDLEQLFNHLTRYKLEGCRVFLVIDNISDDAWPAIQKFLPLIRGPGSKVLLAARTSDILRPAFSLLEQYEQQYYTWDKMQIPSIQETEAIQILLQTSGAGPAALDGMDGQRETIVRRIVQMCNFGSEHYPEYLPLVMQTMGPC